jgi:hypothetical protein
MHSQHADLIKINFSRIIFFNLLKPYYAVSFIIYNASVNVYGVFLYSFKFLIINNFLINNAILDFFINIIKFDYVKIILYTTNLDALDFGHS